MQSSTQHPSETQEIVAHVLGRPSHEVTVQCLRMGGGFGGKEMQPHGFAAIAALGATLTGRPVRLRLNRTQDMTMSGKRHGFHADWRVGFDDDGRIVALDATLTSDGGWSLDLSEPVLARALCHIDNAYWIPNVRVNGRIAKTNKTSQTAFRGFGGPQGMLVIEDILGRCAPLLGLDPMDLRQRNFYAEGQTTPYGQPVRHPERSRDWHQVLASGDVERASARSRRSTPPPEHAKRALAMTPVKFGISFNLTAFNQAGALVHVYKDGSVLINHGGTEMGQGLHTKMLQVAATTLGVPLRHGAARAHPHRQGAQHLGHRGQLGRRPQRRRGQERLRADPRAAAAGGRRDAGHQRADIRIVDGVVRGVTSDGAGRLGGARPHGVLPTGPAVGRGVLPHRGAALGLVGDAGLAVQVLRLRRRRHRGRGRRLHRGLPDAPGRHRPRRRRQPLAAGRHRPDRGRLRAGRRLAHPRGPALGRERRAPTRAGSPTQAASTYKLPSFSEMPEVFNVSLLENAAEDGAVYGSKAVGEPPLMLAFSVREALRQAAAAFGPPGTSVDLASPRDPGGRLLGRRAGAGAPATRPRRRGGPPGRPDQPAPNPSR